MGVDRTQELGGDSGVKIWTYAEGNQYYVMFKGSAEVILKAKLIANLATIDGTSPRWRFKVDGTYLIKMNVIDFCQTC